MSFLTTAARDDSANSTDRAGRNQSHALPPSLSPPSLLAVNPAFLQEIKDSNPSYWDAMEKLSKVCQCFDEPLQICRGLSRTLDDLRDAAALEFSLEESYGYITLLEPSQHRIGNVGLCELAAQTQAEHGFLYLQLSELAEQAEELQYRGVEPDGLRQLVDSVSMFSSQLAAHERREDELIEHSSFILKHPRRYPR